jgi:hypothetical protein
MVSQGVDLALSPESGMGHDSSNYCISCRFARGVSQEGVAGVDLGFSPESGMGHDSSNYCSRAGSAQPTNRPTEPSFVSFENEKAKERERDDKRSPVLS